MNENDKIIANIKTSMQIEGCILNRDDEKLINSFLNDEITLSQGIDIIKKSIYEV